MREKELRAQKQSVEAGGVEIRKEVVAEQRTIEVPVTLCIVAGGRQSFAVERGISLLSVTFTLSVQKHDGHPIVAAALSFPAGRLIVGALLICALVPLVVDFLDLPSWL